MNQRLCCMCKTNTEDINKEYTYANSRQSQGIRLSKQSKSKGRNK